MLEEVFCQLDYGQVRKEKEQLLRFAVGGESVFVHLFKEKVVVPAETKLITT